MAELAAWYQKKIGNYDKQEWETTVEERIIHGLRNVPLKSTKLRPDLIDVDLIRGSSFPKAKPIQGSWTVMRLALVRVVFFPLWTRWWTLHTSVSSVKFFFVLWMLQFVNTILYLTTPSTITIDLSCILIPFSLMAGLGVVHSFIVSTAHQHANGIRCLERRRHSHYAPTGSDEVFHRSVVNSDETLNSSPEIPSKDYNDKGTQTQSDDWQDHRIPVVNNHCVKFDLENLKNKDTSGDEDSPTRILKRRNVKLAVEDDGFESLNGNNSNGSENGDDLAVNYTNDENESDEENEHCKKNKSKPVDSGYWKCKAKNNATTNTVRFRNLPDDEVSSNDHVNINWLKIIDQNSNRSDIRNRKIRKERDTRVTSSSDEECDATSAPSQHADYSNNVHSEEYSYCSEPDESDLEGLEGDSAWEPIGILNPASDRVSCTIWENGRVRKAQLSVVDISHMVVKRADQILNRNDSESTFMPGVFGAMILANLLPLVRLFQLLIETGNDQVTVWDLPIVFLTNSPVNLLFSAFGATSWERVINLFSTLLRLGLGSLVFFLLAVAQRSFRQRFLYSKLFLHLTSARKARQSSLPHFRLNRVRNIKTWLSVRSYLMRRGPQRSVDIIVSAAFVLLVVLITFLVFDLLQEQNQADLPRIVESIGWSLALGAVLLRLFALGTRSSRKQRCLPVLLTEQINLHLAMERRPASKDQLSVANNVLKLAADLLKELDSPFKIPGLSGNPYLYTIIKVVMLSAVSGVLSDILGFKLKLHKIKIK